MGGENADGRMGGENADMKVYLHGGICVFHAELNTN
jgi:hypothetical protein